jgi:dethiobiotin synthetase
MAASPSPFRWFVTATDTGVGKTETACALLSLLADRGLRPAAFKPYESGCEDLSRPADALALREAARSDELLDLVCPHRFRAAVAPGVAARRVGQQPSFERTLAVFRGYSGRPLVVEGAGGLRVPVDGQRDVIDLVKAFRLPVVLVARAGLGTLNHTALSLEALVRRRVTVAAVLLSKSAPGAAAAGSSGRDASERDNASLIAERHGVQVLGPVPFIADPKRRRAAFRRALGALVEVAGERRPGR